MKRCVCALICALLLGFGTTARADAPNPNQSVTYFMNYFNESVVQAAALTDILEREKHDAKYPYTATYVLYSDLMGRMEKSLDLTLNLCDIYHLYSKTTYCFTKDEKTYLFDRIDNILKVLQQLVDSPYATGKVAPGGTPVEQDKQVAAFNARVAKLRNFIRASLPAFNR
jgi:hypothetical protein